MLLTRTNALTEVGLAARQFTIQPLDLIKNLTAVRLPEAQITSALDSFAETQSTYVELKVLPKLEVRESPGKGFGLFAVNHIPACTPLLEDAPLLSLAEGEDLPKLWQKYCALPADDRLHLDDLSFSARQEAKEQTLIPKLKQRGYDNQEATIMARVSSRWQANAFKNGPVNTSTKNQIWTSGVFPNVARINHSCTPNGHTHYRPSSGARLVYSLCDIEPDTEIEISYFDITMPLSDRQARAEAWGFTCSCPACSKPAKPEGNNYEEQLFHLHVAVAVQSTLEASCMPTADSIRDAEDAICFAQFPQYPWLVAALPNLYHSLSVRLRQAERSGEEVRVALKQALAWECKLTGTESPSSQERRNVLRQFFV